MTQTASLIFAWWVGVGPVWGQWTLGEVGGGVGGGVGGVPRLIFSTCCMCFRFSTVKCPRTSKVESVPPTWCISRAGTTGGSEGGGGWVRVYQRRNLLRERYNRVSSSFEMPGFF